jgi:outer membrane protein assembly factor BamE (lipoprotein component of BamABCDE complex)
MNQFDFVNKKGLFFAATIALSACATTTGTRVDADNYRSFAEGKTTKQEVIAQLGAPSDTQIVGSDEGLTYRFTSNDHKTLIPVAGVFMGSKIETQICTFTFGPNGVLKTKGCAQGSNGS